jgi:hypothetical protein
MSVNEILAEIETLSADELQIIRERLDQLRAAEDIEETREMLAAIDEGLRSLKEEGSISIEKLEEEMRTWTFDSK